MTRQLTATELAGVLDLSKGRISQLVSGGQLKGCYSGDGRHRRFDLAKVAAALGRRLDPGQMLGNGAKTSEALARIPAADPAPSPPQDPAPAPPPAGLGATELPSRDPSRYELAKTLKAEEDARTARRRNSEAEGTLEYRIHYVNFGRAWDEWVKPTRLLKMTAGSAALAKRLQAEQKKAHKTIRALQRANRALEAKLDRRDADAKEKRRASIKRKRANSGSGAGAVSN